VQSPDSLRAGKVRRSSFWCLTADCCCLTKTLSPKAPMSTHVLCSRMPYVDGYITALYCIANLPSNKPNPPIPETHWNTSNRLPLGPSDQTAPLSTNQSRVSRPNSGSPGFAGGTSGASLDPRQGFCMADKEKSSKPPDRCAYAGRSASATKKLGCGVGGQNRRQVDHPRSGVLGAEWLNGRLQKV
jgi:hypothetical protein